MGPNTRREFWRVILIAAILFVIVIPAAVFIHGALPENLRLIWFGIFFVGLVFSYVRYWPLQKARIEKARRNDEL